MGYLFTRQGDNILFYPDHTVTTDFKTYDLGRTYASLDGTTIYVYTDMGGGRQEVCNGVRSAYNSPSGGTDAALVQALNEIFSSPGSTIDSPLFTEVASVTDSGIDAAGRRRSSLPFTWVDVKSNNRDLDDHFWAFSSSGSGTGSYNASTGFFDMSVSGGTDYYIRRTRVAAPYAAGKSQQVEWTITDFAAVSGVTKRIGYYTVSAANPYTANQDGFYIETVNGSDHTFKVFRNGAEVFSQSRLNWFDPMDGTGPSGKTMDFANFHVWDCDFLWLGGKGIRVFVYIDNIKYEVINYAHSNNDPGLMFLYPSHPLCLEIRSTGGAGTFKFSCGQINNEGPRSPVGTLTTVNIGDEDVQTSGTTNLYAVAGVRLRADYRHKTFLIPEISVQGASNDNYLVSLVINPSVAGTPEQDWTDKSGTIIQTYIGDISGGSSSIVTGGREYFSKYVDNSTTEKFDVDIGDLPGTDLDGNADSVFLCVRNVGSGGGAFRGSIEINQIS